MSFSVAIANMKGGVGKTTTTVALAETFAASGKRVLVLDLDAQANATFALLGKDRVEGVYRSGQTLESYFAKNLHHPVTRQVHTPLDGFLVAPTGRLTHKGQPLTLSLGAATPELRHLERELIVDMTQREYGFQALEGQLTRLMERDIDLVSAEHDAIFFDCPPGISAFAEAAIRLADLVITPTIPDFISTLGLPPFCKVAAKLRRGALDPDTRPDTLRRPWVLPTKVRRNTKQHKHYLRALEMETWREDCAYYRFENQIPESVNISGAIEYPDKGASYQEIWGPIIGQLEGLMREIEDAVHGT
ncbi:MAG: ParA family protein [Pikeienuella sp.]